MKSVTTLKKFLLASLLSAMVGCAAAPATAPVGSADNTGGPVGLWDVSINTPVGKQPSVWTFAEDRTGYITSPHGRQPISNLTFEGNALRFSFESPGRNGAPSPMNFVGEVQGNGLTGQLKPEGGNMALTVSGTRRQ